MSEPIKFTEGELKEVNDLQGTYLNLQNALGQISIGRIRLDQQISEYDDTTVGTIAGPFTVGPTTAAPISPTAAGKKVWSTSLVNTPGEITFSAIGSSPKN